MRGNGSGAPGTIRRRFVELRDFPAPSVAQRERGTPWAPEKYSLFCRLGTQGRFGIYDRSPLKTTLLWASGGSCHPLSPNDASGCGAGIAPAGRPSDKAARARAFGVAAMALRDLAAVTCPPLSAIPASVENHPPQAGRQDPAGSGCFEVEMPDPLGRRGQGKGLPNPPPKNFHRAALHQHHRRNQNR